MPGGLVEPDGDVPLPVLPEVGVGDNVVMFNHWIKIIEYL